MTTLRNEAPRVEPTRWALWLLLALYLILQITHAWVVDDAYITLRTVHNFVHGFGLRWNPAERVQSYTHPLWMFLLSAGYAITREAFYTTVVVSAATSLFAIGVVLRSDVVRGDAYRPILFMAVLLGSKAFLDYSSSGLENPLTHLLLALFFTRWLTVDHLDSRQRVLLFGLAALGFVNRMDTVLFFLPACALLLYEGRALPRRVLRDALLGGTPALAWVLFSLFYYGSVVPNTAIAKLSGSRVSKLECLQAGLCYLADCAMNDPLTLIFCALAIAAALAARRPSTVAAAAGVLIYIVYVVVAGAIGTHMSGRFFAGALFLSAVVLAYEATHWTLGAGASAVTAIWMAASPVSPLRVGLEGYAQRSFDRARGTIIDTRRFVLDEGGALLNAVPGSSMPRHHWYYAGRDYRDNPERVHIGGLVEYLAIGYSGFAAGPTHHFIDVLGLSDPLIARVPLPKEGPFRPGHPFRSMPEGYLESVQQEQNLISDPDLKLYYEPLRSITRDPLWSWDRIKTIAAFNLGRYDKNLDAYAERHALRAR